MSGDAGSRARAFAGVHVLVDDAARWGRDPVEQARAACTGAPQVVQLRAKSATDRQVLQWARAIRRLTRECGARFVVNDRFDLALAAEADGVHLGQTDLPPSSIPHAVAQRLVIGRSTHSLEQAEAACLEPVDYIAFGPVFETHSKESEHAVKGLASLARIADLVSPRPLIAIGGIDEQNAAAVVSAGAAGFAVISAVAASQDPGGATRRLVDRLGAPSAHTADDAKRGDGR